MDPNTAIRIIDESRKSGECAADEVDALIYWLRHGGFMPAFSQLDPRRKYDRRQLIAYLSAIDIDYGN